MQYTIRNVPRDLDLALKAWARKTGKSVNQVVLEARLAAQRFTELAIHIRHVRALRGLPPLHRDPFDRMLAAQAAADDLVLVTADRRLHAYPVKTLRA